MKTIYNKILIFSLLTLLASCTKVVDIDLNEANQRIVIDAKISYESWDSTNLHSRVHLTRTGSYYTNNTFDTISDANLSIKSNSGAIYPLHYSSRGYYVNSNIPMGNVNDEYELFGTIDGKEITSKSTIPTRVKIDSIGAYPLQFGPHGTDHLTAVCFFTDVAGENNYYRLKIIVNGLRYGSIYITRDDGQDGKQIAYPFFKAPINVSDTIDIELICMDEFSFDYYKVLSQNLGAGGFSAAPGNPESNIKGDAIGIFTAQTSSRASIIAK
jgi:hypothetical protein